MRNLFAIVALLSATAASANVVKPADTIQSSKGLATVGGALFDYQVSDRGWSAQGYSENGNMRMVATKSFLIEYSTKVDQTQIVSETIATSLNLDAQAKCQELGDMEFPGQVSGLDASAKKKFVTQIGSFHAWKTAPTKAEGTFACMVQIDVETRAK